MMRKNNKKNPSKIKRVFNALWWTINVLFFVVYLLSAFGGHIRPESSGFFSATSMAFPFMIIAVILVFVFDIIVKKMSAILPLVAFVITIKQILIICPLNVKATLDDEQKENSFTLMTYNVYNFINKKNVYPDDTNPTLTYIIRQNPDVLALQECEYLSHWDRAHVYSSQVDSVKSLYPYRFIDDKNGQTFLSKFPFRNIEMEFDDDFRYRVCAHKLDIRGHTVYVINTHLYSIQLTEDDKSLYVNMTRGKSKAFSTKKDSELILKLNSALRRHAKETRMIRDFVNERFSENDNIIICGDFNDTPLSHAYYTLKGNDFADAYASSAFGPTITYNERRFYFRIDHVLYRGNLKSANMERGDIKYSDHYPLLTTFVLNTL